MKLKHLIITVAASLIAVSASAQMAIGIKGGACGSWLPGTVLYAGNRVVPHPDLYGGVSFLANVADNMILGAELLYAGRGHSDITTIGDSYSDKYSLNQGYLQLPVLVGFKALNERFFLSAGPELNCLLFAKTSEKVNGIKAPTEDVSKNCNPVMLGIVLQATFFVVDNLGIDVKFDWGVTRTFKKGVFDHIPGVNEKSHNVSVQLGVCYYFEL
ncbi:MAG: PorT family protein [Bacteroidales bacterium]|nr:PorT family protein [Bacteroidales bacterium]